jgi:hypothetical protein
MCFFVSVEVEYMILTDLLVVARVYTEIVTYLVHFSQADNTLIAYTVAHRILAQYMHIIHTRSRRVQ